MLIFNVTLSIQTNRSNNVAFKLHTIELRDASSEGFFRNLSLRELIHSKVSLIFLLHFRKLFVSTSQHSATIKLFCL